MLGPNDGIPLMRASSYPSHVKGAINELGPLGREIANRWMLGWPGQVTNLLSEGIYLSALRAQEELEREVLATTLNSSHLARHEVLQEFGLTLSPPFI